MITLPPHVDTDLVTVLVGPHQDGDASQDVHLSAVIVGGAPAQRHGQRVCEGLLGVAASGQTQGLDIPGQTTSDQAHHHQHLLGEGNTPLEGEHSHIIVKTVWPEVWMCHYSLDLLCSRFVSMNSGQIWTMFT